MVQYKEQKEMKMFIKRRTKLIRNNWRNGITGVENANDTQTGDHRVLAPAADPTKLRDYNKRLESRKDKLRVLNGASEQFNFYTTQATVRKQSDPRGQKVLPMNHSWNTKVRVNKVLEKQSQNHTHENIFRMSPSKVDPRRIESLM